MNPFQAWKNGKNGVKIDKPFRFIPFKAFIRTCRNEIEFLKIESFLSSPCPGEKSLRKRELYEPRFEQFQNESVL